MSSLRRRALAALAGVAAVALWPVAAHAEQPTEGRPGSDLPNEIIVYGARPEALAGILAEDELNEGDISAYGADSIGDLLAEIGADLGESEEGPVVLINGELATGIDEIADLPAEAARRVQLLPRQAAARLGQSPERRVINVVLKRQFNQFTLNAEAAFATAGEGTSQNGNLAYTRLSGGNRTNLSLRVRNVDPLLEADRGVLSRGASGSQYDLVGNVQSYPLAGVEIDPALSALAGFPVTVAGVPAANSTPGIAAFARTAGLPNISALGRYRTLLGESQTYGLNGTVARRLGARTNLTVNLRADLNEGNSLSGVPSAVLRLPAGSPYSPFGQDVGIARYFPVALGLDRKSRSFTLGTVLNRMMGLWNLSVSGNYAYSWNRTTSDRSVDTERLQADILAGIMNPFAPLDATYLAITQRDLSRATSDRIDGQAVLTGPLFTAPAGPVNLALRVGGAHDSYRSSSTSGAALREVKFVRNEINGQINLDVPIASRAKDVLAGIGDLSVSGNFGFRNQNETGTLTSYGYGFTWQPDKRVSLRGSVTVEEAAPALSLLQEPVLVTENVRFFDILRGETVDVRMITGGNPALPDARRKVLNLGANARPFDNLRLNFSADYTRTTNSNAASGLPPLTAAIQQAFGERFVRDASGRLVEVDVRPVSFARDRREQLRWGFSFNHQLRKGATGGHRLGQGIGAEGEGDEDGAAATAAPPAPPSSGGLLAGLRMTLTAYHTWTISNTRLIRAGLPEIDLLNGGAVGYGGGQPRHQVQVGAGLAGNGVGIQTNVQWKSATRLRASDVPSVNDLRFSPRALVNLRVFGELGTLIPQQSWSKGLRLTLSVNNLFDSQQTVRDVAGATPLRYQPYLLDPLGRTVSFGLRKVF